MQNTPAMDSRELFPGLSHSIARASPFFRRCPVEISLKGEKGRGKKKGGKKIRRNDRPRFSERQTFK
jgi:hypothetical protein